MQPEHFMQLHRSIERLHGVSPLWPAVLAYCIAQCGGFMEQLTLGEADSSSVLVAQTAALLDALPADSSDRILAQVLAAEFDGFYWHGRRTHCTLEQPARTFFRLLRPHRRVRTGAVVRLPCR